MSAGGTALSNDRLPKSDSAVTSIGPGLMIKGQVYSDEDLFVDGVVEGSIDIPSHRLTVGPHGRVTADINAEDVVVLGIAKGSVDARNKLELRKEGKLAGDIKTGRITIEDGADFKGSIEIRARGNPPAI